MEWFLIIVIIVVTVMVMLGSLYVLVYFQAEEDKNTAIAPKVAVVLGLSLSCLLVLTLPLDVANRSTASGLDMETLWQVEYMLVTIMAVGVVPFLIFYYEAEDPESRQYQWWTALKYEALTVVVCVTLMIIGWLVWGYAEVPIVDYAYSGPLLDAATVAICPDVAQCPDVSISRLQQVLKVSVTPVTWIMALVSFLGWFLFVLFGGIGMAALPMDLLVDFSQRPVGIDLQEYAKQKMALNQRALQLLDIAKAIGPEGHRATSRKGKRQYNKFVQAVYFLERDWEKVKVAYKQRGGNPLKHIFFFGMGLVSAVLSLTWLLHIVLYIFVNPPADQFLNKYFMELDAFFALFGVATYAIYVFYLLFCVIKGNMKFGLRFFCLPIHPMRIGNTMMNALLFNVLLLLITSVSVVQFCTRAFASYARLTAADLLFGVQVENLMGLNYFFQRGVFLYAFVSITLVTLIYLSICPTDKRANFDDDDDPPI
jgi:LMBR1 domain-containing protein 1